jgi:hypothetical protein
MGATVYRIRAAGHDLEWPVSLAEAQIGPAHEAVVCEGSGPSLYSVPGPNGTYEWVEWAVAAEHGWSDNHGQAEYPGFEPERRFVVLYCLPARRAWPFFWRRVDLPPQRLDCCRAWGEAEAVAGYWIKRRQLGFHYEGWLRVRQAWGWDDRKIGYHEDCDATCGCCGPDPERDFVLIVEFETEGAARRPDVIVERQAWMAWLDVERALAITAYCDGSCAPACAHCSAMWEEWDAAWEWLSTHRREVKVWRRRRRAAAVPAAGNQRTAR